MKTVVSFLFSLFLVTHAHAKDEAQAPIEEIVVTGDFRDANISEVGASVSVLQVDDQADRVNHLEEILGRIANVNFSSGASRARFLQIRGIGERGQFAEPLNASVGLLVDGVDLSGIGTVATLHDVQQVEVFRGPQGTLYGANALAGLINVVTHDPLDFWGGEVSADIGDYDARGLGAVVSGPLTDRLGLRVSAYRHEDDGFIDNGFLRRDDTNRREELSARAKLAFVGDDLQWTFNLARIEADNGYDAFSLDNDRRSRSDQPGRDVQDTTYASLFVGWDLSDAFALQATVAASDTDARYGYDEDWTFAGFHPDGYSSTDFYGRERRTQTIDLRLVADHDALRWVAGVYALRQDVDLQRIYTFQAQDFFSGFEVDRLAAYGEVEVPLTRRARLKAGLRLERHDAAYDDSAGVRFSPSDDMLGGRLVYEFDLADDAMLYAAASRGYKAGGFNTDGTLDPSIRVFEPELLWNLEAGYKGGFADGRVWLSASVFYMLRRDIQINTSRQLVPGGEFVEFTDNAAKGFNRGLELEFEVQATDTLRFFGSLALLDTEYDDFVNAQGVVRDGRSQAQAPDYQFFLGAELRFAPRWFARLEVEGRDAYFFSDTHDVRSDAYELLHASLGYEGERWQVTAWGRNVTDEDYFVRGFFFGNDPRDGYGARSFTQLGEPARLGLSGVLSF